MSFPARLKSALVAVLLAALAAPSFASQSAEPRLKDIALDPASFSLLPGRAQAMRAIGSYSDGSTRDLTSSAVLRSRDTKVAVVSPEGLVVGVAAGRTDVTATDPATGVTSRTAAKVTVVKLKAIVISPAEPVVRVGGTVALRALGTYEDGTSDVDITAGVEWSSKSDAIAKTTANPDGTVSVIGVAAGTTTVVARDPATGVKSSGSSGTVTVVRKLASVLVSPAKKTLRVAERSRFKAIGTFEKDARVDITADVDWQAGNPAVATIDATGRVTGVALGSTAIQARDRATGVTSTASAADGLVTVVGAVSSLRVTPVDSILPLAGTVNLKATASFAGQTDTANFTTKVDWASSAPDRVSVDKLGRATCLAAGTVFISARDSESGVSSTTTGGDARVLCGLALTGIDVTPAAITLGPGKTKKVKAFYVFEDGTQVDVTKQVQWTSTDRKIATVDVADPNIGRVTAVGDGIASIVARDPATGRSSADPDGTSCTVTVQGQPTSIQIEPDPGANKAIEATAGTTLKLKVLAKFVGGSTRGFDAFVTWSSSAPDVVHVSNGDDGDRPGFARFGAPGTATVAITYPQVGAPPPPDAKTLTDSVTVNVR
jgi:hypothetical protein